MRPRPRDRQPDQEVLTGQHCVREALRAGRRRIDRLWIEADRVPERGPLGELAALAERSGVAISHTDSLVASPAFGRAGAGGSAAEQAQHVALEVGPLPLHPLEALTAEGAVGSRLLVALDEVQDPQNLGAIARVVDAVGAQGLVVPERRSAWPTPAASRASAGALEWLPIAAVGNLAKALGVLAESGFWSLGTLPDAPSLLYDLEPRIFDGDLVVVLGAEGKGIRPAVRKALDHEASLPAAGRVESMNVSTAASAALFEVWRRRRGEG